MALDLVDSQMLFQSCFYVPSSQNLLVFKVSEVRKEWFDQFHPTQPTMSSTEEPGKETHVAHYSSPHWVTALQM